MGRRCEKTEGEHAEVYVWDVGRRGDHDRRIDFYLMGKRLQAKWYTLLFLALLP